MAKKPKKFKGKNNKPPMPKPGDLVRYNTEEYWVSEDNKIGFVRIFKEHDHQVILNSLDERIQRAQIDLEFLKRQRKQFSGSE